MNASLWRFSFIPALLIVIGVPFLFRPPEATPDPDALRLVIITPHQENIRTEFERGFDRWHRANFDGQSVVIDWRTPGGTSEIRRQLEAEYIAALKRGPITQGTMTYDLLFGGGTYEHGQTKRGVRVESPGGEAQWISISVPAEFSQEQLDAWYGENAIGRAFLYDPEQHWLGTAVSGFGIVYNRDIYARLGVVEPATWSDLGHPQMAGWIALADPSQSGSIATAFEVILQRLGWKQGWSVLQDIAANSRYFADSSSKVPIDASLGEAAAGMCIDFYGRSQAQATRAQDGTARLIYVDPVGLSDIDPDPISLLRGAPHPELAKRFIAFCLSEQGQSLWQFALSDSNSQTGFGPQQFELRRLPIRRVMYQEKHFQHFVDQVNPYELTRPFEKWNSNARRLIGPVFTAMAINAHVQLRQAWEAIHELPDDDPLKAELLERMHTLPTVELTDGRIIDLNDIDLIADAGAQDSQLRAITDDWKYAASPEGIAAGHDPQKAARDRIGWTEFFRTRYEQIVDEARQASR